jgi:hypothetical protein
MMMLIIIIIIITTTTTTARTVTSVIIGQAYITMLVEPQLVSIKEIRCKCYNILIHVFYERPGWVVSTRASY